MYIVPASTITLHNNIPTTNPLYFKTQSAQDAYFASHILKQSTPCQYVKHSQTRLRVACTVAQARQCPYISFVNPSFENVTYYARVTDVRYVNNETTEIEFAIDKWLTYGHEATYFDSAIVRESESLADVTKATANPYDEDLIDFDTPEDLPMSDELEEPNYTIDGTTNMKLFEQTWDDETFQDIKGWMNIVCISPFTPISTTEEQWWTNLENYLTDNNSNSQNHNALMWDGTNTEVEKIWVSTKTANILSLPSPTDPMKKYVFPKSRIARAYSCYIFEEDQTIVDANNLTVPLMSEIIKHVQISNGNILGIYKAPLYVILSSVQYDDNNKASGHIIPVYKQTGTASGITARHKKLCRAPYARVDLLTPFGDRKSYAYENFKSARDGNDNVKFGITSDINLSISMTAMPMGYKIDNMGRSEDDYPLFARAFWRAYNYAERIEINQFPEMPYATDSFLTALASANAANLRGATQVNQHAADVEAYKIEAQKQGVMDSFTGSVVGMVGKAVEAGASGSINPVGIVSSAVGFDAMERQQARSLAVMTDQQNQLRTQRELENEADNLSLANIENTLLYKNMAQTKRAYGYEYHAGTGDGRGLYSLGSFVDFVLVHIKLRDEIIALYDKYFDAFGLASRRIDIPRVLKFSATEDEDKPSWWSVGGYNVTYIKTEGLKVGHPSKDVADYLRTMFDGGVQFINGADLT